MLVRWQALGELGVSVDGSAADLGGRRPLDLLAMLLCHPNQSLPIDRIVDEIWPKATPRSAKNSVQRLVSDLRTALGPARDRLKTDRDGYRLIVLPDEFDLANVEDGVEQLRPDESLAPRARFDQLILLQEELSKTVAPGSSIPSVTQERQRIRELRVGLIETCGRLQLDHGFGTPEQLQRWSMEYPLNERLAGQLMISLGRSGRQAEALSVFRSVQARLLEELGIDPSPALVQIELDILRQNDAIYTAPVEGGAPVEGEALGEAPVAGAATGGRTIPHVPAPLRNLIGRQGLIEQTMQALHNDRLVTLTGTGGAGKTSVALEVADIAGPDFDVVYFVSLADVLHAGVVAETVAASVGLGPGGIDQPGLESLGTMIGERLAAHRCLLVVEHAGHLIEAVAGLVTDILSFGGPGRILVTSRERLAIPSERVLAVDPLPVHGADTDGRVSPAVELFAERGEQVSGLDRHELLADPASEAICQALDGLPLAIELAAAQLNMLSSSELADRISEPLRVLGKQRSNDRQATLGSLLDWSWRLLSPIEQDLLAQLSLYRSWSVEVAEFLDPETGVQALSGLVSKSLVHRRRGDDGISRYYLLEIVRDYGLGQLAEMGMRHDADRRHAMWVLSVARQPSVAGCMVDADVMDTFSEILYDLLAALSWLKENACSRDYLDLAGRSGGMFSHNGPFFEGRRVFDEALKVAELPCPLHDVVHAERIDRDLQGAVLVGSSSTGQATGDVEAMVIDALRAVELAGDDAFDWAPTIMGFCAVTLEISLLDHAAESLLLRAEAIAPRTPSSDLNASSVAVWRGCWEMMNRRYSTAISSFDQALSADPCRGQILLLSEIGSIVSHLLGGQPERASAILARLKSSPNTDGWHYLIDVFSAIAIGTVDTDAAVQRLTSALGDSIAHDLPGRRDDVHIATAIIAWHAGERDQCVEMLKTSTMRGPAQMVLIVEYADGQPGQAMSDQDWRLRWRAESARCLASMTEQAEPWVTSIPEEVPVRQWLGRLS